VTKALFKVPHEEPMVIELERGMETVKEKLGGSMEAWSIDDEVAIYCNSDSLNNGMTYNCSVGDWNFQGPILLLRFDEHGDLESVTNEDVNMFKKSTT